MLRIYGKLYFLSIALKKIYISVTYAIWSGVGIVVLSVIWVVIFKEDISALKIIYILFIILGVAGLNLREANDIDLATNCNITKIYKGDIEISLD